jgi:sensor histidine kinase YesM
MSEKVKRFVKQFALFTFIGAGFGIGVANTTPIGYSGAMIMCMGCTYCMMLFDHLTEIFVFPRFTGFARGKKLTFRMISSLFAHIAGWFIPLTIAGAIIGFRLFQWQVFLWLGVLIIVLVITHSIHMLVIFYRELNEKDVLEEKLKTLAAEAELKALRAQINPHFLFNSLNTIASLIHSDPAKAEASIIKLADIFRYALSASDKELVTLGDEIAFVDSYLEIEKARFGERLQITRAIPPDIIKVLIPSLVLQPLVENSIKHGSEENGKMTVAISVQPDGDLIRIGIKDEGKGIPDDIQKGIYSRGTGLRNVSERLRRVYGEPYGLAMKKGEQGGTIATITIPRGKK